MYKPSMFNYIHRCEDNSLRLYNSFIGTQSLLMVDAEKSDEVVALLHSRCVDNDNITMNQLVSYGYMIPISKDEKAARNLKQCIQIADSQLHIIILPTEQCNFRCKYCYESFNKGAMSEDVQDSIVKMVRKNMFKYTSLHVSWFGGEPLEAINTIKKLSEKFLDICKTSRKEYNAGITTNGFDLTPEVFDDLYKWHIFNYQITIDGTKDHHNKQRVLADGEGTYDKIILNLKKIKETRNLKNTSFLLRTNFTRGILEDFDDYYAMFNRNFGDNEHFSSYIHMASDWGGDYIDAFRDNLLDYSDYRSILKKIASLKNKPNLFSHLTHLNGSNSVCYAARANSYVIGCDGSLYKCTGDFNFDKNHIGSISSDGDLMLNDNYISWVSPKKFINAKCDNCFFSGCCLGINCPAVSVRELDNERCCFEKEHIGDFLELFSEKYFYKLRRE